MTVVLCLQHLSSNAKVKQEAILISEHIFLFETRVSPWGGASGGGYGNRMSGAKVLIVFHSNYGSILFTGRFQDGRRMTDAWIRIDKHCISGP